MPDKRRLVGNDMVAGGKRLNPRVHRPGIPMQANYEAMQERRERLIKLAADPPRLPLSEQFEFPDTPKFNQIAYSVLLIAILAVVAVATSFINWAFLAYGLLAVAARFPSTQMFTAALITLVFIPVTSSLNKNDLSSDFAVMTFYFLVIGLVRAILELRRDNKKAKKSKKA